MDENPSGNYNRQESTIPDRAHSVRPDNAELADNSWKTRVKTLFTSLDEAEGMRDIQPNRQQEILMNFLRTVHLYKPSDGYWIWHGIQYYSFREVVSEVKGLLARSIPC